jgi:hypothetical protein
VHIHNVKGKAPDLGPDSLDDHGIPASHAQRAGRKPDVVQLCAKCKEPGGDMVTFDDGTSVRLHRHCEQPWREMMGL